MAEMDKNLFRAILRDSRGVSAVEYGLLAGLLGIASVQALTDIGRVMSNAFAASANEVASGPITPQEPPASGDPVPPDFSPGSSGGASGGGFGPDTPAPTDPGSGGGSGGGNGGGNGNGNGGGGAVEPPMAAMAAPEI